MPPDVVEALGVPLGRAKAEEPKPSALAEEPKKEIAPVLIVYDESGEAKNSQQAAATESSLNKANIDMTNPWFDNDLDTEKKRTSIFASMHVAYSLLKGSEKQTEQVNITGEPTKAKSFKVFAKKDMPVGSLLLIPLVPSAQYITATSTHPDRIPTAITDHKERPLEIAPCVRLGNESSTESPCVFPFWHIQRNKEKSKCNCVMTSLSATSRTTIGAPGSDKVPMSTKEWPVLVHDETCDVLVCTNDAALAAGDELVLFKPEKVKVKKAK